MAGWDLIGLLVGVFVAGFIAGLEVLRRAVRSEIEASIAQAERMTRKLNVLDERIRNSMGWH